MAGNNAELKPDAELALMNVVEEMTKSAINFACGIASRRQGRAKEVQTADLAVYLERTRCAAEVLWGTAVSRRQRSQAVSQAVISVLGLLNPAVTWVRESTQTSRVLPGLLLAAGLVTSNFVRARET